jgi:hypothetical protein
VLDAQRIDLNHLGVVGTMEVAAELELLTGSDVPVVHGPSIPHSGTKLHSPDAISVKRRPDVVRDWRAKERA